MILLDVVLGYGVASRTRRARWPARSTEARAVAAAAGRRFVGRRLGVRHGRRSAGPRGPGGAAARRRRAPRAAATRVRRSSPPRSRAGQRAGGRRRRRVSMSGVASAPRSSRTACAPSTWASRCSPSRWPAQGATVRSLDWRPPAEGDPAVGRLLARLEDDPDDPHRPAHRGRERARPSSRLLAARPMLVDVRPAREALGLGDRQLLHSGPPIDVGADVRAGPGRDHRRAAVRGLGARRPRRPPTLAGLRRDRVSPCHHHGAVGPMAGRDQPVDAGRRRRERGRGHARARDAQRGPGQGPALRRVRRVRPRAAALVRRRAGAGARGRAPGAAGRWTCGASPARRSRWATRATTGTSRRRRCSPARSRPSLVRTSPEPRPRSPCSTSCAGNDHFFLNLSMAACKSALDAAHGIEGSTVVTAMARNGVDFGVRMSGTGDAWFTTPVGRPGRALLPGLRPRGRQPRPGRQRDHRDVRHRRLRDGRRAGDRAVRGRQRRATRWSSRG